MSEETTGLRKEPLFGRRERLYAADSGQKSVHESRPSAIQPKKKKEPARPAAVDDADSSKSNDESNIVGWVSTGFELLGISAMTVGGFLLAPWVGWMVLGALLVVLGVATGYGS